jgi:hypothetical protein
MPDRHGVRDRIGVSDVNVGAIFGFGAGLAAVGLAVYLIVWLLFVYFDRRELPEGPTRFPLAVGHEMRLPPEPRLQVNPRDEMRRLRGTQEERLNRYEWVDKSAGVVRIPIAEAMRLTVQRGLPARVPSGEQAR